MTNRSGHGNPQAVANISSPSFEGMTICPGHGNPATWSPQAGMAEEGVGMSFGCLGRTGGSVFTAASAVAPSG